MSEIIFRCSRKKILVKLFLLLIFSQLLLVFLDYIFNFIDICDSLQIRRIFNIAKEQSVPTWFSVLQFFFISCVMFCVAAVTKKNWRRVTWIGFALFFLFMSMDDAAAIHERLGTFFNKWSKDAEGSVIASQFDLFPSFGWQFFVAPFYVLSGMLLVCFLTLELKCRKHLLLFFFGMFCFALALGIDYFEGIDDFYLKLFESYKLEDYTVNHYAKVLEECLEMFGQTCILIAVFSHLLLDVRLFKFNFQ